jgi:2-polyprenyl-3-methyl-5-hydroxy-6-metoxy-1,4-benzoquinol methylase
MDSAVAQRLVALNHQFYQTFASPFSDTRQRLQPGVTRVLERVLPNATILDVGCGNGQLWRSLVGSGFQGRYVGLDFSPALLGFARTPPPEPTGQAEFLTADLADPRWDAELPVAQYDTILALAVFHHLPGSELQRQTARIIRTHLSPQGSFVLSAWQFLNSPRLAARVQPWEGIGLHPQQLDPGDYLLDWRQGGTGLRYVHQFSATELESLARETGFTVVDQFYSDGENHHLSLYQTWKKTGNDPGDAVAG